jgi:hypothetical protein
MIFLKTHLHFSFNSKSTQSVPMRRFVILITLGIMAGVTLCAQGNNKRYHGSVKLDPRKGFITINELTYAFGLSETTEKYANSYLGFNTINGYQINKSFVAAGGTGIFIYNEGKIIPLFLDFQYRFYTTRKITSYAYADGGFLFNVTDHSEATKLFVNPGIGMRHDFSRDLGGNLGFGMMIQQGSYRSSFVNIKLGITFKP